MERPFQPPQQAESQTFNQPGDEITSEFPYFDPHAYPSQSQGSHQQQAEYNGASRVPNQAQQQPPSLPVVSTAPTKSKQKYYKPIATGTPILSLFLLSTFIFIAGIEVILRRGIPITTDTSIAPADPEHLLSYPGSLKLGKSADQLGNGIPPYQLNILDPSTSCIGIEMIVSVQDVEHCGAVSSTSCFAAATQSTYTKPIYNIAIPTMPCYACAIQSQGIEIKGFITATTTYCPSCESTSPATIYPCPTCEGTILDTAPVWETTPTELPKPYITYTKNTHDHKRAGQPAQTSRS